MRVPIPFRQLVRRHVRLRTTVGGLHVLSLTNEEFGKCFASQEGKAIFGSCAEPYWPFVWAGGWATATLLLQSTARAPKRQSTPGAPIADIVIDLGCGGGICGLASLVAPTPSTRPPIVVFNDIDETALQVAGFNMEESCRAGCFSWAPKSRLAVARRRAIFSKSNLLAMDEHPLKRAMQRLSMRAAVAEAAWQKHLMSQAESPTASCGRQRREDTVSQPQAEVATEGWWSTPNALPSLLVLCGDVTYTAEVAKAVLRFSSRLLRMAADAPSGTSRSPLSDIVRSDVVGLPSSSAQAPIFSSVSVLVSDPGRHAFRQLLGQVTPDAAAPLGAAYSNKPASATNAHAGTTLELAPELQAHGLIASVVASFTAPPPIPPANCSAKANPAPPSITSVAAANPASATESSRRRPHLGLPPHGDLEEAAVEGLGGHSREVSVLQLRLATPDASA